MSSPRQPKTRRGNDRKGKTTISDALKRRAQTMIKDKAIDVQSRVLIRYALETNDAWLGELVRRVDACERIIETVDLSQTPPTADGVW